jgi:serine/threonine protein phosphatase 1
MAVEALLKFVTSRGRRGFSVPNGERIYAIGDVHGRRDLLDRLLKLIANDDAGRGSAHSRLIFLGDLIDRGPDSFGVVECAIRLRDGPWQTRFLMGNHEEVFLRALRGDLRALRLLIRIGGRETILSYGVKADDYRNLNFEDLAAVLIEKVPETHVAFLSSFEESVEAGDYLFVHAGIRPGVSISEQSASDMRWIRDDFLRHRDSYGKLVIHGHSVTEDADVRPNRIGIDTGAYATGRLTAIGLEKDERWFLST